MTHPSFADLGLTSTAALEQALTRDAIKAPSAVQAAAIAPILAGRDVVVRSSTGTGKTLAYLLPLLQRAAAEPGFRAVVVAPVPELAVQILRTVEAYRNPGTTSLGLIGGGSVERQRDKLKKHPQVLVGTPGRVLELILAKKVKTASIDVLVLDEVDDVLSHDNAEALHEICSRPEFAAQVLCVSATIGPRARAFVDARMAPDHVTLEVAEAAASPSTLAHRLVPFTQARKETALLTLLHKHRIRRAIVFVNKLYNVGHLYRLLHDNGVPVVTLSTERNKRAREQAMRAARSDAPCVLVATDAAARGLDVRALDWVIHFEMARDPTTYLHRAGRTGRAGRPGTSLVMAAPNERHVVRQCEKELKIRFD